MKFLPSLSVISLAMCTTQGSSIKRQVLFSSSAGERRFWREKAVKDPT